MKLIRIGDMLVPPLEIKRISLQPNWLDCYLKCGNTIRIPTQSWKETVELGESIMWKFDEATEGVCIAS